MHALVCRPVVAPHVPAGHGEQAVLPAVEYLPASQVPVHALVCRPAVSPHVPAGHGEHVALPATA